MGLPGSGLEDWAIDYVREDHRNRIMVSRRKLRYFMGHDSVASEKVEKLLSKLEGFLVHRAIDEGMKIVIADNNLNAREREKWESILIRRGVDYYIKHFPVTLEEAIKADAAREHGAGEKAIRKMYDKYISGNFTLQP